MTQEFDTSPELAAQPEDAVPPEQRQPKIKFNRSTVVLGVLIAAAAGGLWFMHYKSGPGSAAAAEQVAAQQAIKGFLGNGQKNMASMKATLAETEAQVDLLRNFPAAAQVPLEDLSRDPFREAGAQKTAATQDQQASARDAALKKAAGLKLQSIMFGGAARSCLINGQFKSEGDSIDNFQVERINPDSVIVKNNGFRFALRVQH